MIDYNDKLHRYSHKGVRYTSATQLIEEYKDPFDVDTVAREVAYKRGATDVEWKQRWKEGNKESLVRGSREHDAREEVKRSRSVDVYKGQVLPVPNTRFLEHLENYMAWPDGSYPELILWNHYFRIAGRADLVRITTRNGKRYASIHDYKTNKLLRKTSYYIKLSGHVMLRYPLNHIMACNFMEYTLQLSIYAFMLEDMGFIIDELTLEHIPHVHENAPPGATRQPVIEQLEYRRNDVLLMLNHHNEQESL